MTAGAITVALAGASSQNEAKPKDAVTNIFYILKSGVYGVVSSLVTAKISDNSLFTNSEVPINETPYSERIE